MEGQYPFQQIYEDTILAKQLKMVGPIRKILVTTKNGKDFLSKLGGQQTSLEAFRLTTSSRIAMVMTPTKKVYLFDIEREPKF